MENSFWDFLIYGGVATGVYMWGKKAGVEKAVTEYNLQAQIADQQKTIDALNAKLDRISIAWDKDGQK